MVKRVPVNVMNVIEKTSFRGDPREGVLVGGVGGGWEEVEVELL